MPWLTLNCSQGVGTTFKLYYTLAADGTLNGALTCAVGASRYCGLGWGYAMIGSQCVVVTSDFVDGYHFTSASTSGANSDKVSAGGEGRKGRDERRLVARGAVWASRWHLLTSLSTDCTSMQGSWPLSATSNSANGNTLSAVFTASGISPGSQSMVWAVGDYSSGMLQTHFGGGAQGALQATFQASGSGGSSPSPTSSPSSASSSPKPPSASPSVVFSPRSGEHEGHEGHDDDGDEGGRSKLSPSFASGYSPSPSGGQSPSPSPVASGSSATTLASGVSGTAKPTASTNSKCTLSINGTTSTFNACMLVSGIGQNFHAVRLSCGFLVAFPLQLPLLRYCLPSSRDLACLTAIFFVNTASSLSSLIALELHFFSHQFLNHAADHGVEHDRHGGESSAGMVLGDRNSNKSPRLTKVPRVLMLTLFCLPAIFAPGLCCCGLAHNGWHDD